MNARREQRRWFRFAAANTEPWGELKIAGSRLPVRLLDESANGYAVIADSCPEIQVDDQAELRTSRGRFEVGVSHVTSLDAVPDDPAPPPVRIGLAVIRELTPAAPELSVGWRQGLWHALWPSYGDVGIPLGGIVFVALVVGLPVVAIALVFEPHGPLVRQCVAWTNTAMNQWLSGGAGSRPELPALPPGSSAAGPASPAPATPAALAPAASTATTFGSATQESDADVLATVRGMRGASPFVLPAVVRALNLTEAQQEQIHRIHQLASEAVAALGHSLQTAGRRAGEILDQARKEVLRILDDQQRAQWSELESESETD